MTFDEWWQGYGDRICRHESPYFLAEVAYREGFCEARVQHKKPEWRPIETAPTSGESVLLYYGPEHYVMEGRCFKRERGYRKNVYYQWVTTIDMGELEPTHWMPLPDAPEPKDD